MSGFEPGPGWREVTKAAWGYIPSEDDFVIEQENGSKRYWVREAPVPALPTERYTVILLHGDQSTEGRVWVLCPGDPEDLWFESGWKIGSTAAELHSALDITGFEVLAEPRAVTAKAVVSWVRDEFGSEIAADAIAREFGASS